jgi:hypothetical protein
MDAGGPVRRLTLTIAVSTSAPAATQRRASRPPPQQRDSATSPRTICGARSALSPHDATSTPSPPPKSQGTPSSCGRRHTLAPMAATSAARLATVYSRTASGRSPTTVSLPRRCHRSPLASSPRRTTTRNPCMWTMGAPGIEPGKDPNRDQVDVARPIRATPYLQILLRGGLGGSAVGGAEETSRSLRKPSPVFVAVRRCDLTRI